MQHVNLQHALSILMSSAGKSRDDGRRPFADNARTSTRCQDPSHRLQYVIKIKQTLPCLRALLCFRLGLRALSLSLFFIILSFARAMVEGCGPSQRACAPLTVAWATGFLPHTPTKAGTPEYYQKRQTQRNATTRILHLRPKGAIAAIATTLTGGID